MATKLAEAGDKEEQVMDMFTSDERREIAARLRDDHGYEMEYDFLVRALGMPREDHGPCDWSKVHERLADLIEPTQDDDDICLTPTEAAKWLGIAPQTLADWRSLGRGPNFVRDGRYVVYSIEELRRYRDAHLVIIQKAVNDVSK